MNKLKRNLLFLAISGIMSACSSEPVEEIITPDNDRDWQEVNFASGVEEGTEGEGTISTRAKDELGPGGVPAAKYPDDLAIYMHEYSGGKLGEVITICTEGEAKSGRFKYSMDKNNNEIYLKSSKGDSKYLTLKIEEPNTTQPTSLFFFASQMSVSEVELPRLPEEDDWYSDKYPNATTEFGDRLFATDGYFFGWKDAKREQISLYLLVRTKDPEEIVENVKIVEIEDWEDSTLALKMKRLTSCLSVRLTIVDKYNSDGTIVSIPGVFRDDSDPEGATQNAIQKTDEALKQYIEANKNEIGIEIDPEFSVENIFIRKKILTDFPAVFDWENGLTTEKEKVAPLYLCNLNYPAWMNSVTSYEHGDSYIQGLTSICDNEPFIPADGVRIENRMQLHLFMGISDADHNYDKLMIVKIPIDSYDVHPNKLHSLYIGFTLKNVVDFYKKFNASSPSTRSVEEFILSPDQISITSEPYRSTKE